MKLNVSEEDKLGVKANESTRDVDGPSEDVTGKERTRAQPKTHQRDPEDERSSEPEVKSVL